MNNNVKVSNKEICIPHKLLENIIKETDVQQVIIEEEESELFYTSLSGQGKIFFKNNTTYEGTIKYGILDSGEERKTCKITFPNNTKYEGEIKQNQITGHGVYHFPTALKFRYKGEVKNGLRNGYGVYNSNDGIKYEGNWWNGLKHGQGKLIIKENMFYEGEWFEGIKHGSGRIKWPSGNIYDGEFNKNKIAGNGYMIWVEKNEKYTGKWSENLQNGLGIHIWYENKGEQKYLRNRYVGEWKNGFRHGYGVFFYSNGAKYEGIWDQNYKHGFGIFTFHDGSQYIGRFHNDRMMDYNAFGYLGADDKQLSSKDRNAITTAKLGKKKANPLPRKNSIAKFENENSFLASQKNKERENTGEKANKDKPEKDTTANANLNQNNFINTVNSLKPQNSLNNAKENLNKNNKEKSEKTEKAEKTENSNSKEEQNQTLFSSTSTAKLGFGKPKPDLKANLNAAGLEAISEQAELGNLSMMQNEKKEKETSNALSYNNVDSAQVLNSLNQSKQVISNRILKESEYNVFKTLIDLTDIIECEPEIEASLKEVENILLRNLSDMKIWYRFYTNKDKERDEAGTSVNASALHTQQDEKEKVTSKEGNEKKSSLALNYFGGAAASNININFALLNAPNNLECVYNNDLGFAMEMKDLWKFLRDSNIISSEFSLAQFNRLFYKGKKNYIEMFMCPDDIETKQIYDYIYAMIVKSKEEFYYKNRDKLLTNNLFNSINNNVIGGFNNNNNNTNSITNSTSGHIQGNANFRQISVNNSFSNEQGDDFSMQRKDSSNHQNNFNNKNNYSNSNSLNNNNNSNTNLLYKNLIESNMDIHNKKQIVLLRQFFEAIVRAAYLRFFHIGQSLGTKLTILIDTCIKNNSNFKKTAAGRKSNREQTDNSINSSVYLDKKNKGFDSNFEFFTYNFEKSLKAIFKKIYLKFSLSPRLDDITITYRCFYDNYISKSEIFKNIFSDKFKFVEIINIYHKDKINVLESAKYTKEIFNYVENLYDIEIIFFEFCEVVFFMSRKYFSKNGLIDTRENYAEIVKDLEETIANLDFAGQAKKSDKGNYTFPKLKNHLEYESLISNKLAKEEEERKKRKELKRIEYERKMMEFEDLNILQDENEEEPEIDDESLESY